MSTQFTAFISYSHRDSRWAKWVQRAIENYRLPKALASEMGRLESWAKSFAIVKSSQRVKTSETTSRPHWTAQIT